MDEYKSNPFFIKGVEQVSRKIDGIGKKINAYYGDNCTVVGEYGDVKEVVEAKYISGIKDVAKFKKLYEGGIDIIANCGSKGAIQTALFIAKNIRPNQTSIYLESGEVREFCGIKQSKYYEVIHELVNAKIIAKKYGTKIEYWVNPNIVFNGRREILIASAERKWGAKIEDTLNSQPK